MCPLPRAVATIAARLGASLGQRYLGRIAPRTQNQTGGPRGPNKASWDPHAFLGWGCVEEFSSSTPLFLSTASSLGCRVSSGAQISPLTPPSIGHPPSSRRDFGKEINTRWERAGLPGTHSLHAKSCWREWVRGPGRAGGAPAPGDCSPRSPGLNSQPRMDN